MAVNTNEKTLKGLSKALKILAKIGKVCVTILIPLMIIVMLIVPSIINNINVENNKISFNTTGETIEIVEKDDKLEIVHNNNIIASEDSPVKIEAMKKIISNYSKKSVIAYSIIICLSFIINLVLIRFILSHTEQLFKNINEKDTPFTLENVLHLKKMAYFMIASVVIPIITGIIGELILTSDLDINFEVYNIMEILFLFAMAYIFKYGTLLQEKNSNKEAN